MNKKVLIIGGYGNFGSFIAQELSKYEQTNIIIAGRNADKAKSKAKELDCDWYKLDISHEFKKALAEINPSIVIHTSGPFQGQDYTVAKACLEHGCHYIDLADGRDFVHHITQFDEQAKSQNTLCISGASAVPCLSSCIINYYQAGFKTLKEIDYGIATAQRTGRGLATTKAVLGYVGKPFTTLINGQIETIFGWQDMHFQSYTKIGKRLLSNCEIPDLDIFPKRYPDLKTIRFYAGLEVPMLHTGLWILSWLVRYRLCPSLDYFAAPFLKTSHLFYAFGTKDSAFHMQLSGIDQDNKNQTKLFQIIARNGDGPYIPCIPSIVLTKKIINGSLTQTGAMPCIDLITLEEYQDALAEFDCEFIYDAVDKP